MDSCCLDDSLERLTFFVLYDVLMSSDDEQTLETTVLPTITRNNND